MGFINKYLKLIVLFLSGVYLLSAVSFGQQGQVSQNKVKVVATLDDKEIKAGEKTVLRVSVSGFRGGLQAPLVRADGLTITFNGQQFQFSNTNRLETKMVFSYQVYGENEGVYEIPAIAFDLPSGKVESNQLQLKVNKAPPRNTNSRSGTTQATAFIQIEPSKNEFYVGEEVPFEVILAVDDRILPQQIGTLNMEAKGFTFPRFDNQYRNGQITLDGDRVNTWTTTNRLIALQEGEFDFGPVEVELEVLVPSRSRRSIFFQSGTRKSIKLKSVTTPVVVKPLPSEGKPDSFTGLVGSDIQILSEVVYDPGTRVGDPIQVLIEVQGVANFDSLEAPEMTDKEGWRFYDAEVYEKSSPGVNRRNKVSFSRMIIAEKKHNSVPSFEVSYFDVDQEKYITKRTLPMPIQLSGSAQLASNGSPKQEDTSTNLGEISEEKQATIEGEISWGQKPKSHGLLATVNQFLMPLIRILMAVVGFLFIASAISKKLKSKNKIDVRILKEMNKENLTDADFFKKAREVVQVDKTGYASPVVEEIEKYDSLFRYGGNEVKIDQKVRDRIMQELSKNVTL